MKISVFDRIENIGKGEIACTSNSLLLSPQCFENASFPDPSKGAIVCEWVKEKYFLPIKFIIIYTRAQCL